jgi:GDP-mannose transporter
MLSPVVFQAAFIAVGYAASSSCLVVINKWALIEWPYSTSLTFLQLTVSWMVALLVGKLNIVEVDTLELKKMKAFAPACLIFFVALACNMKLLQHANVDTFIVLRATVPLLTTIAETIFLGTPLPNAKVFATLVMIIMGAIGYVMTDSNFSLTAYFWGFAYVMSMVIDTILVKKVVSEVSLKPWGLVLYNNLSASMLYPVFLIATGEHSDLTSAFESLSDTTGFARESILASCFFGVAISYFGMNARKMLQATAFSVLGVVCKFATVLVNTLVWEYHASMVGIGFMCVSLTGGILYQQAMQSKALTVPVPEENTKNGFQRIPTSDPEETTMDVELQSN